MVRRSFLTGLLSLASLRLWRPRVVEPLAQSHDLKDVLTYLHRGETAPVTLSPYEGKHTYLGSSNRVSIRDVPLVAQKKTL